MTAVAWSPDTGSTLAGDGVQPTTGAGNQPTVAPPATTLRIKINR